MSIYLEECKKELNKDGWYFHAWHIDDVIHQAKDMNITIEAAQAHKLLQDMMNNHDAELGINWDMITVYLQDFDKEQ